MGIASSIQTQTEPPEPPEPLTTASPPSVSVVPAEAVPADAVEPNELHIFVIDKSGSMSTGNYKATVANEIVIPTVKEIVKDGTAAIFEVFSFNDELSHDVVCRPISTPDEAEWLRSTLPTVAVGLTRYWDSMIEILNQYKGAEKKFETVSVTVYTDGEDNQSGRPFPRARTRDCKAAEDQMNTLLDERRAAGWMFNFMGIEMDPTLTTKSARSHECFQMDNRSSDQYAQCRAFSSGKVISERANKQLPPNPQ